jgi:hypothetical protein
MPADTLRQTVALTKACLSSDLAALEVLRPAEASPALERLWRLDPLGAALVEEAEREAYALIPGFLWLFDVMVESAGLDREQLIGWLGRQLELPSDGPS